MLHDKSTNNIQEIGIFFNDTWTNPEFFQKYIDLFNFNKTSKLFKAAKEYGVPYWDILRLLFILPFTQSSTINSLYNSRLAPKTKGEKDVYYRALGNQKINWRNILLLFVKRYLAFDNKLSTPSSQCKCLLFDDTDVEKSGKKIEGVSKVYNHVSKTFVLGYKLLVAGYWNDSVFIPVDFSFHRESKGNKNRKYGLTKKELKQQKKTQRGSTLPVLKRYAELNYKKTDVLIEMFKRIYKRKIAVDYILFDSWFTTLSLISELMKISKKVNIIGMYKYNSTVEIGGKQISIRQLRKRKSNLKRSRKFKFYYQSYKCRIKGVEVSVFLIRKGKNGAWHTILSTDTGLSFNSMMEIYNIRWTIEVFFKETKQLLGLGKSQSTNFDVQVAQMTITMIQYLLISLRFRQQAYETIGGLFKDIKQDYIEYKLNDRILFAMIEILLVLEFIVEDFDIELTISKLIRYSDRFSFLTHLNSMETLVK